MILAQLAQLIFNIINNAYLNSLNQICFSQDDFESKQKREEVKKRSSRSPVKKRTRPSGGGEGVSKKVRGGSASNSDQETIQINIRNSPALERMNKNKAGDTSDDEQVDKILKNRPRRSPSPSPTKR